jgi:carbon-monoxide dehydrogenase medium subunit
LTEIHVPAAARRSRCAYLKAPQQASGFAIVGVAVALRTDSKGRCEDIGIGVTGLGEKPFRARAVEERLRGNKLGAKLIEASTALVSEGVDPLEDLNAAADYRAHLARIYAARAVEAAAKRLTHRAR